MILLNAQHISTIQECPKKRYPHITRCENDNHDYPVPSPNTIKAKFNVNAGQQK